LEEAMNTLGTSARRSLEVLRESIAGDVLVPADRGYDEARRAWNLAANQRPAVVVFAQSAADVIQAVRFARLQGIRIAPQGTGHGAAPVEPLEDALLLKTSRMRRVDINAAAETTRAEAGAIWQDVTVPAAEHGLAALAGSSPNVGVTGYTLGGGLGWLARRYGLAANSVTAVEIVTPDGRLGRADAEHEPDLFWAVKGGGGGVGVVTALEMTLYPVSELYAGVLFFPIARSREVLQAWRDWTGTVPDEVTSIGRILRVPLLLELPEFVRGRAFVLVEAAYLGDAAGGAELLRPLRELSPEIDTFATIPAPELQKLNMDSVRRWSPRRTRLPEWAERRAHFLGEELRLLAGGEMAAFFDLVEVGDVGVRLLDPATGCREDLAGKRGEAHRDRDRRRSLAGRASLCSSALPVRPRRRGSSARQPVERDVVEDVVPGEIARGLPVDEGAGDLVVAVGVVVEHAGRQSDR
jgi:FAD/FMN-containing dehydrogenase